jgi:hypothetical protein
MIILPVDPLATPPKERAEAAVELVSRLRPGASEVELRISDKPDFIDCGGNFVSVFCPFCQTDIVGWWTSEMQAWCDGHDRRRMEVKTPCCGRSSSLNDLDYVAPQGFACVAIEAMNPGADLEPEEFRQVETVLGMPARIIWRHI